MSERCEQMSERTSEWPSTYVSILGLSEPQCSSIRIYYNILDVCVTVLAQIEEGGANSLNFLIIYNFLFQRGPSFVCVTPIPAPPPPFLCTRRSSRFFFSVSLSYFSFYTSRKHDFLPRLGNEKKEKEDWLRKELKRSISRVHSLPRTTALTRILNVTQTNQRDFF